MPRLGRVRRKARPSLCGHSVGLRRRVATLMISKKRFLKNAQARRSQAEKSAKPVWAFGWFVASLSNAIHVLKMPRLGAPRRKRALKSVGHSVGLLRDLLR